MLNLPPPSQPRSNGVSVAVLALIAVAIYGYVFLYYLWPLAEFGDWSQHWPYLKDGLYTLLNTPGKGTAWQRYQQLLAEAGYQNALLVRLAGLIGGSLLIIIWLIKRSYRVSDSADRHVRGLQYLRDCRFALSEAQKIANSRRANSRRANSRRANSRRAQSRLHRDQKRGLRLHPDLAIGANQENLGVLAVGARGSGKTQFLLPLLQQVIDQNHRAIIFDYKGEYTETLPLADDQFILIAPWDKRSAVWHIAADVRTRSDARLIAQQMIRDSEDPMWSNSSRQVLTGLINYLCQTQPDTWRFSDLAELISASNAHLAYVLRRGNREAVRIIENLMDDGKTAQSVVVNMTAYMSAITDLADAWDDSDEALPEAFLHNGFSIRHWLADDYQGPKVIVLQGSARYEPLMQGLLSSLLSVLIAHIVDPSLPEAIQREDDYRLYFFLDEFPRLGRIPDMEKLISVGRSKGVRPLLGFQDIGQVRHYYGNELATAWFSQLGTQFFGRVAPGDTANWIAQVLGKQEVDRPTRTVSANSGSGHSPGWSESLSWQTVERSLILPSQLATDLTAGPNGITALLHCTGWPHLYRLRWPITQLPKRRPASVQAPWTTSSATGVLDNDQMGADTGFASPTEPTPAFNTHPDHQAQQEYDLR